jgi:hypothetical protein
MAKLMMGSIICAMLLALAGCGAEKSDPVKNKAEKEISGVNKDAKPSLDASQVAPLVVSKIEEDRVYESSEIANVCNKINDVSTRVATLAGNDFKIPASSVRFLSSGLGSDGSCRFQIDTAAGPKTCPVLYLIRKGGKNIVAVPSSAQTLMCGF